MLYIIFNSAVQCCVIVVSTPTLDSILPIFPNAILLKTTERTIFPPPSMSLLLPLLGVQQVLYFCCPSFFSTTILISKSLFFATWHLLQYHDRTVVFPFLCFASFMNCSVPLNHFIILMIFLRCKNGKRDICSALAKILFSWCVGKGCAMSPAPTRSWRYSAVQHQIQFPQHGKRFHYHQQQNQGEKTTSPPNSSPEVTC